MPIANAKVEIFKDTELIYTGYTDENGRFTKMLDAGTYKIRISKEGYLTVEKTETLTRSTELMVNLPSELYLGGYTYEVSVYAGVDISRTVLQYTYETEVV